MAGVSTEGNDGNGEGRKLKEELEDLAKKFRVSTLSLSELLRRKEFVVCIIFLYLSHQT